MDLVDFARNGRNVDLVEVEDVEPMNGAGLGAVFIVRGRQSRW